MFPQDQFRLTRKAALLALISAAFPMAAQGAVGRLDFAIGEVSATGPDGKARALAKGAEINQGDTINTGTNGRAQVRFTDGAYTSIQPSSQFRVDQYNYTGQADGSEKGFFSLLKGAMRTITGAVGRVNRQSYKVDTPTATIGIRGTEFVAALGNSLNVTVGDGIIEVCNAAGCLIINAGESAYVRDPNTAPIFTFKKADVPAPPPQRWYEFGDGDPLSGYGEVYFGDLLPTLPTGPGYHFMGVGLIDGGECCFETNKLSRPGREQAEPNGFLQPIVVSPRGPGTAYFDGSAITGFEEEFCCGFGAFWHGASTGGLSDGVIGWDRWSSGQQGFWSDNPDFGPRLNREYFPEGNLAYFHVVVGQLTPSADLISLNSQGLIGTYSLLGFTFPTAYNSSTGALTLGTQPVTGSLTADFANYIVAMQLGVPIGGQNFQLEGSTGFGLGGDWGMGIYSSTGPAACGGAYGMFVGPMASRAGAVYTFNDFSGANLGVVQGAVTFAQSGLTSGGCGCCC